MRTLRQAAALLSSTSPNGLQAIAATLGFGANADPLDPTTRDSLGIPSDIRDVRLIRGHGALRALLVVGPAGMPVRTLLTTLAAALSARTAHVLWTLIAKSADGSELGIGCWTAERRPPRVVALVVRRTHIVASDAESLCALEAASIGDDLLVHTRWCELLGRDALSSRFYRVLEQRVGALARSLPRMPDEDRSELALVATSRLLFLCFLQAKGWLDGDRSFLLDRFDACMADAGCFHQRVMLPLFFGTLNTPIRQRAAAARRFGEIPFLNGGLFARTALERRHASARFSDEALGALFGDLLGAYRFTAREDHADWSEVAVDPEMLGRAFESLMAVGERHSSGAYYTPQQLVSQIADQALAIVLSGDPVTPDMIRRTIAGDELPNVAQCAMLTRLRALTVLDPACGSGAFLVQLLERITQLRRAAGDVGATAAIRREVLARAIHGVDVNPMAVWLCELRLWLSVVIESEETRMSAVTPLPNLDCNVRVGDTLAGDAFTAPPSLMGPPTVLLRLHERYVRATGAGKAPLRRALAREERRRALATLDRELLSIATARRERAFARRTPDLFGQRSVLSRADAGEQRALRERAAALRRERRRLADGGALPFSFPSHFGHVHARGGFQLVIGNPPWVRLHNIPPATRAALRAAYHVFREPGWGPPPASADSPRFSAQVDLAALFVERSVALTRDDKGAIALLLPAKLWRSLSGGPVRRLISAECSLRVVEDWSNVPCAFDAAAYPSMLIASRPAAVHGPTMVATRGRSLDVTWCEDADTLRLDRTDSASPWLFLPPDVRRAFDLLRGRGRALGQSALRRAMLGVKCGCNDAFIASAVSLDDGLTIVEHRGRRGVVERAILRPLLRGEAVTAWRVPPTPGVILWTHDGAGSPLATLPAAAAKWLAPWRRRLRARTDLRGSGVWWTLFRTEAAESSRPRVVWSDFGRVPRAAVLAAGDPTVPLNSCYVVSCDDIVDALTLTTLLNSPACAAWLNAVAEPARGGWHRYLAWTVALLPLPHDWARARAILAPLAERAMLGNVPTDGALHEATCRAYRVRPDDVAPLLAWCR